jgi:VCBS repeat-containing protein
MRQLWQGRRRKLERQDRRAAFLFEPLESRHLMAGDLDLGEGEGTAPTLAELPDIVLNAGSPQWVPLDGFDVDGGTLTYTVTSNNQSLVQGTVPTGNKSLKMSVAGFGDMYFQLFEHLSPRVTNRIIQLVESGFYDDTATNTITFHRILNDFVIQAGDPTGTGSGGSTLGNFDDQFHVDLQHNRSGLLSMAKSSDDTNDSQFFITEEKNETQQITLNGSPTGGTFTLTYFNQTTAPISFSSTGNFATMAASIKSALESLSLIGAGNVNVTHDPILNSSGQVTDNRRWKVEFKGELGHQEVVNLTGNASGLTGGSNRSVGVVESKSARHLDFNHSIFGILTQGESVRDAISNVTTNAQGTPTNPPVISNVDIIVDPENGALLLKAPQGASGETDVTVRVTDAQGNFFERTFSVMVTPDGFNGAPFLNDIAPIQATAGQPVQLQLAAQDVEGDPFFFDAVKPTGNTVNYTLSVNNNSGLVTITPPVGFTGSFQVLVAVKGATTTDTGDQFDRQLVTVNVGATAPTAIDLLAASDTGFSDTDNDTNASSLQFQVSGVTNGAVVKLKKGTEVIAQGTATGSTITLTVNNSATALGEGTHTLTATQTPAGGQESSASAALDITLDTTAPGAFTTTSPTEASVGLPLVYDATAPGEGSAGFVYTLGSAPTGAQISGVTGELIWTPAENQVGSHVFQIIATDPAGNSTSQTVNLTVGEPLEAELRITLVLVDANQNPLTSLGVGQEFFLQINVEDVRGNATGAFSVHLDVLFDALKAEAIGQIVYGSSYQSLPQGSTSTPGLINELGAVQTNLTTPLGDGVFELARIPMRAKQAGLLTFTADPADDENSITAFFPTSGSGAGNPSPVPFAAIRFGTTSIEVETTFLAVNDTFNVDEDSQNQSLNPLANDEIETGSGDVLTIDSVGTPSHGGTVTISTDGKTLIYTPAANFFGSETFTYTAENQDGAKSTATITVQVAPKNDPPTANDDTLSAPEDSTNFALDVLANDSSAPDGTETLKVTAVTQPTSGGTVAVGPSGNSVTITPANNFIGTLTFTYTLSDGNGGTDTATVTVTVTEGNDNPTASNDNATVAEDSTGNVINVLANDSFAPDVGETLTVTAVSAGTQGGTVTVGTGGANVVYTPAANFQGTESFTYTISDGRGGTATATVLMTVTNANNDPPTANNDTLTAFKNTATPLDVLANDSSLPDPTENLTIESVTQPTNGTVTISADGKRVIYTPSNNFTGSDSFTYKIKDPSGAVSQSATVNVNVADFVPSSLAGFVRLGSGDRPIAGVTVTLTATINNQPVSQTTTTAADGSYKFENLAPGTYTITQSQPATLVDGAEVVGSQGGTSTVNDKIVTTITSGTNGTGNNFTEQGRPAAFITLADFYARNSRETILAAFNSAGTAQWYSTNGSAWDGYTNMVLSLNSAGTQLTIKATNPQGQSVQTTIPTSHRQIRLLGSSGGSKIYQIGLTPSSLTWQPVTPTNGAPTAVANQYTTAEDAALTVAVAQGVLANDTDPEGNTLTATVVTQPTNGTLTLNANGSFTYTPNANFNGTDTFTYRAGDGTNQSAPATVTITVTPVSDNPAAANDSYSIGEDAALTVPQATGVLANDSDPDSGTTMTAVIGTQPANGTLTLNANGSFTYTPNANFHGTDTFTYRASDGTNQSAVATVTITVQPVNDAPAGVADTHSTAVNTALTIAAPGVLANDTDVDNTTLTAINVTQPANGTVTLNANGSFTYTPDEDFTGSDTFTYQTSDGTAQSTPVTVTINVQPSVATPEAVDDAYTATEDTALTVNVASGVLDNDNDDDGDTLTAVVVTQPASGTLTLNADGSFTYTPNADFHGTDTFTYRAGDGSSQSEIATVTITVSPVNDAPETEDDAYSATTDTVLTVNAAQGVLANDEDVDDDDLTVSLETDVEHGTLVLNADGSFSYTPDDGFSGTDTFVYEVSDGNLTSQATVTITVGAGNTAPAADDDAYTTGEDTPLVVSVATGVLANDEDAEDDDLETVLVVGPEHGELVLNADGSFTYTPDENFHGTDTFTYRADDGNLESEIATVTITVSPVNDTPTGTADAYTATVNTQLVVNAATGVLGNDVNVDGDSLSAAVATDPTSGALTLNLDGSFTYIPETDFVGEVTFTYTVTDGVLTSDPITVTITVDAENTAPEAVNDTYSVDEDSVLTVDVATGVLNNDTDEEGDTLSTVIVAEPANGTLVLNSNGSFTYTPDDDFTGTDTFTYRASDASLESEVATVTITVNPVNDAPSAAADAYTVEQDTDLTASAVTGVLANDIDADGNTLTVTTTPVVDPEHGTVTLSADGSFTYTPETGFVGTDSFTYEVTDGTLTSQAAVTITVEEPNVAPVSVNDLYDATEDLPLAVTAELGVLANDSDANSDDLTVTLIADALNGTLQLNADGSFSYIPDPDFHGTDGFSYRITDGELESEVAAVTIVVAAVNDAPLAAADAVTMEENGSLSITAPGLLDNDTDVDGDSITVVVTPIVLPEHGTLTLQTDGSFVYTPDADFFGTDTFTYQITDGTLTGQAVVTVTVEEAGEGEASSPDDALLAYLLGLEDEESLAAEDDHWETAIDETLAALV